MEIVSRCTACSTQFKVDAKYAGKKAQCPTCATIVAVPSGYAESLAPPPPISAEPSSPPMVQTGPLPTIQVTSGSPTAGATSISAKLKKPPLPVYVPIAAGSVVAVVLLASFYGLISYLNGVGTRSAAPSKGVLVFALSAEDRKVTSIYIDDKEQVIPFAGVIKFEVNPGEHRVVMKKSGGQRIEDMVTLRHGDRKHVRPQWNDKSLSLPLSPAAENAANTHRSDQVK